jgi:hypothetical protein
MSEKTFPSYILLTSVPVKSTESYSREVILSRIEESLIACNPARQIGYRINDSCYDLQEEYTSKNIAKTQELLKLKAIILQKI